MTRRAEREIATVEAAKAEMLQALRWNASLLISEAHTIASPDDADTDTATHNCLYAADQIIAFLLAQPPMARWNADDPAAQSETQEWSDWSRRVVEIARVSGLRTREQAVDETDKIRIERAREAKKAGVDAPRSEQLKTAIIEAAGKRPLVIGDKFAESILDEVRRILGCRTDDTWPSKRTIGRRVVDILSVKED